MDWVAVGSQGLQALKKYRYVALVLLIGLILMALPEKQDTPEDTPASPVREETGLQEELAQILSKIKGAGKVEVLLTEYSGSETVYQTDLDQSDTDLRRDTVLISDANRGETGLVRQVNPPVYQGALIVCQGGDSPSVKLAIVNAVKSVTGLSSNQITVVKMK